MPADQPRVVSDAEPPPFNTNIIVNSQSMNIPEPEAEMAQPRFDTFTRFPKLPLELRLIVWKLALPNGANDDGNRLFCLQADIVHIPAIQCSKVTFSVASREMLGCTLLSDSEFYAEDKSDRDDMQDISLLSVCRESRDVFLDKFSRILPAKDHGVIRFDDQTSIHIKNFSDFLKLNFREGTRLNHPLPSFDTVRKLVCAGVCRDSAHIARYLPVFSGLRHLKMYCGTVTSHATSVPHNATKAQYVWLLEYIKTCFLWRFRSCHPYQDVPSFEII